MASGEGFRAPVAALMMHARDVEAVAGAVELARSAAAQVHLGRQVYGLLCQFLPTLLDPIHDGGIGSLRDAVDALGQAAEGVRASAGHYHGSDARAAHRFDGSAP